MLSKTFLAYAAATLAGQALASCPESYKTHFTNILQTQDGAWYNLPDCAKGYIANVQSAVGCENANCLVEQAAQAMRYIEVGVQTNCSDCAGYAAATDLFRGFVGSVAADCGMTVPPMGTPTSGVTCGITSSATVSPTSIHASESSPSPTSTTVPGPSSSPVPPVSVWQKASTIGGIAGAAAAVTGGNLVAFWLCIRRRRQRRELAEQQEDARRHETRNAPVVPNHEPGQAPVASSDTSSDSHIKTANQHA